MKNKKSFFNKLILIFQIISIIIILLCFGAILIWKKHNSINEEIQTNLITSTFVNESSSNFDTTNTDNANNTIYESTIDFSNLMNINPNTVGWIKVNGTNIDYSVVQSTDNSYYLNHSFDNSYNSAGWIFADYRNKFDGSDKNILIYGHNRKNGSMFSTLENILDSNWYLDSNNQIITLYSPEKIFKYQVFSVYQTSIKEFDVKYSFVSDNEFYSYIKYLEEQSIYDFNIELLPEDKLLTLSTCADNNYYRIILHGKLIK